MRNARRRQYIPPPRVALVMQTAMLRSSSDLGQDSGFETTGVCMRTRKTIAAALLMGALAWPALAPAAAADTTDTAPTDPYAEGRRIIADLQRIETPNGVQEHFTARIGGLDQWIEVRGKDRDNPLLLFVHGGPASPMMPVSWTFQRGWEDYFTVVQWDQRGAGKTYNANDPAVVGPTLRIDRYVDDTLELMALLRQRYGQRKLVLVGHSWGTAVALKAALRHPDWVHAYVGIGQIINFVDNEKESHAYALRRARAAGNREALADIEALGDYPGEVPLTRARIVQARRWAQHYGGLSAYRSDTDSNFFYHAPRLSPVYSAKDRAAINNGSLLTLDRVLPDLIAVDFEPVRKVDFPVLMYLGRHDYTTPSEPTARWLATLQAPYKRAVWFEHSSHLAPVEEPGRVLVSLVQDVLPLTRRDGAGTEAASR